MMNRGGRRKKSKSSKVQVGSGQKRHCSCSPPNFNTKNYSNEPPSPPMHPVPVKRRRLSDTDTVLDTWERTQEQSLALMPSPSQSSDWESLPVLSLDSIRQRMTPSPLNSMSDSSVIAKRMSSSRKRHLCKDASRCWFHSHKLTVCCEENGVKPSWVTFSSDNSAYNPVVNDDGGNTTTSDDDTNSHAAPSVNSNDQQMLSDNGFSDTNANNTENDESSPNNDQEEKHENGDQRKLKEDIFIIKNTPCFTAN